MRPREWKGSLAKWIHHRRIWNALDEREQRIAADAMRHDPDTVREKIEGACRRWATGQVTKAGIVKGYAWKAHNTLDAIGIGLWELGRTDRGGRAL